MTKIICIEGLDGSGKTTLMDRVKKKLEADGQKVLLTSPFLTTDYDVQFKSDILNSKDIFLETTGMANVLYRFQNYLQKLIDSNEYDVILIDRYLPTFYVYQMYVQDHQSMLSSMLLDRLIVRDTFNIGDIINFVTSNGVFRDVELIYSGCSGKPQLVFFSEYREQIMTTGFIFKRINSLLIN